MTNYTIRLETYADYAEVENLVRHKAQQFRIL